MIGTFTGTARARALAWCAIICGLWSGASYAQLAPPPVPPRPSIDQNGIDLASGALVLSRVDVSIGQPGAGGLVYAQGGGVANPFSGVIYYMGNDSTKDTWQVSVGSKTETFYRPFSPAGAPFYAAEGGSSTFAEDSTGWTHTSGDGTVTRFGKGYSVRFISTPIEWQLLPDGELRTFHYTMVRDCGSESTTCPVANQNRWYRLQSVTNNRGYQIKIIYASSTVNTVIPNSQITSWGTVTSAMGINMAVDWCDPTANGCSGLSQTWPTVTYPIPGPATNWEFRVTDAVGVTTAYSLGGTYTKIRSPGSSTWNIQYNFALVGNGYEISSVTRNGRTWGYSLTRSTGAATMVVTDPANRTSTYVFDSLTRSITSFTNTAGEVTSYSNDSVGRPLHVTLPSGQIIHYEYDARGNTTKTKLSSYPAGLPDLVWTANFDATCTAPKKCNKPNYTIDPKGFQTDYTYDPAHGGLTSVTLPAAPNGVRPSTNTFYTAYSAYYKNGPSSFVTGSSIYFLTKSTTCRTASSCSDTSVDQLRTELRYGADGVANNRLLKESTSRDGAGSFIATTTMDYDNVGNRLYVDGPLAGSSDRAYTRYDAARRVIGAAGPAPNDPANPSRLNIGVRTNYDSTTGLVSSVETGNLSGQTESAWSSFTPFQTVVPVYDEDFRVVKSSIVAGGIIQSVQQNSFDNLGRLDCTVTRMNPAVFGALPASACSPSTSNPTLGSDRIVKYGYDNADRTTSIVSGYGQTNAITVQSKSYFPGGLVEWQKDGNLNKTSYTYDRFGRLSRINYPHATSVGNSATDDFEEYGYDLNSQITSITRRNGTVIATPRDALGRIERRDIPGTAEDVYYTYDNQGRLLSALYANNPSTGVVQAYDGLGRLASRSVYGLQLSYQYDLAGQRKRLTYPDGFYVDYEYTNAGEMRSITDSAGVVLATYGYDQAGYRTSLTRPNSTTTTYAPDASQRLQTLTQNLSGTAFDETVTLQYNAAGQIRTRSSTNDAAYTWSPPQAPYSNTVISGVDGKNQLKTFQGTSVAGDLNGNVLSGVNTLTYSYDALGQLRQATGGSSPVAVMYEPMGNLLSVTVGSDIKGYLYDGDDLVVQYDSSGAVARRFVHGPESDEPIVMYSGAGFSNRIWLHADERGSIVAATNQSGVSALGVKYSMHGDAAALASPFGYTGQLYLPELQLYYYKARMYSPKTGRFMQPDPIGYEGGTNLYAYVGGDPINAVDPSGLTMQCTSFNQQTFYTYRTEDVNTPGIPEIVLGFQNVPTQHCVDDGVVVDNHTAAPDFAGGGGPGFRPRDFLDEVGDFVGIDFFLCFLSQGLPGGCSGSDLAASGLRAGVGIIPVGRGANVVYRSVTAAGKVQYVGITNSLARRAAEHLATKGIGVEKVLGGLSRSDARAVEQALIQIHGLSKNGGTLMNVINSIATSNPSYASQLKRGYDLLQSIGY